MKYTRKRIAETAAAVKLPVGKTASYIIQSEAYPSADGHSSQGPTFCFGAIPSSVLTLSRMVAKHII